MTVTATYDFDPREYYRALRATFRHNAARWLVPLFGIGMPAVALWAFVIRNWDRLSPLGVVLNGAPWIVIGAAYLRDVLACLDGIPRRGRQLIVRH